jgi:hypothetical protein
MKKAFELPHRDFDAVKQRLDWCQQTFGPRQSGGTWDYHAVDHMVVIQGETNISLYLLRWA